MNQDPDDWDIYDQISPHPDSTPLTRTCLFSEISVSPLCLEGSQLLLSIVVITCSSTWNLECKHIKINCEKGNAYLSLTGSANFLALFHSSTLCAIFHVYVETTVSLSAPSCCWLSICGCLPTVLNHSAPLQATPLIDHSRGAASENVDSTQ